MSFKVSASVLFYIIYIRVNFKQAKGLKDFSNSLIIHQEKTKKITTVTVVWICDPNYHKILPTLDLYFSKNY